MGELRIVVFEVGLSENSSRDWWYAQVVNSWKYFLTFVLSVGTEKANGLAAASGYFKSIKFCCERDVSRLLRCFCMPFKIVCFFKVV